MIILRTPKGWGGIKEMDGKKILEDMDEKYKQYNFKFFETHTGAATHVSQVDEDNVYNANFYRIAVPQDQYFVMGDNRDF